MMSSRWRPVFYAGVAVVILWVVALSAYIWAKNSRVTAERVEAYVKSIDLAKLSAADREAAIRELADKLNALSFEERQRARMDRSALAWFQEMTEQEKSWFIEATMPSGFKNMITAFEQLPEEKRRRAVGDALRNLKTTQSRLQEGRVGAPPGGTNMATLSPELQDQITRIGLKSFYSESSAQTKAELAPVLEELQRVMRSGRIQRR